MVIITGRRVRTDVVSIGILEEMMNDPEQGVGNKSSNEDETSSLPTLHHRFIRLNPRFDREETLRLLKVRFNLFKEHPPRLFASS